MRATAAAQQAYNRHTTGTMAQGPHDTTYSLLNLSASGQLIIRHCVLHVLRHRRMQPGNPKPASMQQLKPHAGGKSNTPPYLNVSEMAAFKYFKLSKSSKLGERPFSSDFTSSNTWRPPNCKRHRARMITRRQSQSMPCEATATILTLASSCGFRHSSYTSHDMA